MYGVGATAYGVGRRPMYGAERRPIGWGDGPRTGATAYMLPATMWEALSSAAPGCRERTWDEWIQSINQGQ